MNYKVEFKAGSFVDFANVERKFIVAAVSMPIEGLKYVQNLGEVTTDAPRVTKSLSIGIAICNPADTYDEEIGKKIAFSKAISPDNTLRLFTSSSGMINTKMVQALIDQEIEYFKNYPESHIKGYNNAMYKYMELNEKLAKFEDMKARLSPVEWDTVAYIKGLDAKTRDAILTLINEKF